MKNLIEVLKKMNRYNDFDDFQQYRYLNIKEAAAELKCDVNDLKILLLEAFLETYINEEGYFLDLFNGDFISPSSDFSAINQDVHFKPEEILIKSEILLHLKTLLQAGH
jgi:hypothetical protein|tara:strand:- start:691 stop:1017 length:327 start_codon:yes stop_codon:yes gene_type:complete